MEEAEHIKEILENTRDALVQNDSATLRELSNQTIHCASRDQDAGSITIAVIIYTLSKLLERKENSKIKNWEDFVRKINSFFSLAISAAEQENEKAYNEHLERARKTITSISVNMKPYIQEVLRKASINKASKIYEHGISLGQTAQLLGITQWELSEYSGQTNVSDNDYNKTLDIKKRAKMALEFFS